jgi:hypothetical protein
MVGAKQKNNCLIVNAYQQKYSNIENQLKDACHLTSILNTKND